MYVEVFSEVMSLMLTYSAFKCTGLSAVFADLLLCEGGAAKEAEDRYPDDEEGADADECAGPLCEVGEAKTECGQGVVRFGKA